MRKIFTILLVAAGLGLLAAGGCTDAGDPVHPQGKDFDVAISVGDFVGAWDNLHLNGTLTGDTPVAMSQDGLGWTATVKVTETGGYGFGLYTDDGTKAMVLVSGDHTVVVDEVGTVTGDTEIDLVGNATDGFRIVVTCYNPAYDNIKFKGAPWDEDWSTVERDGMSADGTVFFRNVPGGSLAEGTYEWGAIHDDGTEFGVWLVVGPNPVVTVGAEGDVSGTLGFEITAPEPETVLTLNCDMTALAGTYTTVHVRGTFNDWDQAPTDLSDPEEDGIWTVDLPVEQNSLVVFKFIYDGSTYEDVPPACGEDDGYGGYNRALQMGTESATFSTAWSDCPPTR